VVAFVEAADLTQARIPVARHATARVIWIASAVSHLAILRRVCAVAANRNSSWAPPGRTRRHCRQSEQPASRDSQLPFTIRGLRRDPCL